ncbi:MAG: hypothetical protein ACFFEN_05855 [Candidatus Thorarchaeota archaeon]
MSSGIDLSINLDLNECPFYHSCTLPKLQSCKFPECKYCPDYINKLERIK